LFALRFDASPHARRQKAGTPTKSAAPINGSSTTARPKSEHETQGNRLDEAAACG
jgi:hypothetical protein